MMRSNAQDWRWRRAVGALLIAVSTTRFGAGPESTPNKAALKDRTPPIPGLVRQLPELVSLYTHLHTHPELSRQEVETSKRIAEELRKAGAL